MVRLIQSCLSLTLTMYIILTIQVTSQYCVGNIIVAGALKHSMSYENTPNLLPTVSEFAMLGGLKTLQ